LTSSSPSYQAFFVCRFTAIAMKFSGRDSDGATGVLAIKSGRTIQK